MKQRLKVASHFWVGSEVKAKLQWGRSQILIEEDDG